MEVNIIKVTSSSIIRLNQLTLGERSTVLTVLRDFPTIIDESRINEARSLNPKPIVKTKREEGHCQGN